VLTAAAEPSIALTGLERARAHEFASRRLQVEFPPSNADWGINFRSRMASHVNSRSTGSDRSETLDAPRRLSLEVLADNGRVIADRMITVRSRTVSDTHIRVTGSDRSQTLNFELLVPLAQDVGTSPNPASTAGTREEPLATFPTESNAEPPRFNLRFEAGSKPPSVALPVLRFLQHLHAPNRLAISVDTDDGLRRVAIQKVPDDAPVPAPAAWLDAVRSLAFVQRAADVMFPIPDNFSADDLGGLRQAESLLRGNTVEGHWETLTLTLTSDAVDQFEDGQLYMLEQEGDYRVTVAGHHIPVGDALHSFRSARVVSRTSDTVSFEPGPFQEYTIRLTEPPPRRLDDPLGAVVQLDGDILRRAAR
jgi:hypothetical protein